MSKRNVHQSSSSEEPLLGPPKKRYRHIAETKSNDDDADEVQEIPVPAPSDEASQKGGKAWQMMAKMGYKTGAGLGAQSQGRAEPIDVKLRSRRRGLGAEIKGLEPSLDVTWDEDKEQISVEETAEWIPECNMDVPTAEELEDWIKIGPKRLVIDKETHFCDEDILSAMIKSKSVFDELNDRDLRAARARANPFETIKGAFFQNRAAMKMANLDAVFDDLFTNPKTAGDKIWVPKDGNDLFYFADVCAGPGGFTEYVLWRRGWSAHGFGLTLRGKDDFRLDDFLAASPEMFEPFYGKNGIDGDGDITNPENLEAFKEFVLKATGGHGVHTVMADGGFSVEGQENIQEILSKRLYLCQTLCAMNILRSGGSFVCKLFDVFTPFSVGLIYLLWRSFDEVSLHKPHTSRPANSERYVICKRMRDDVDAVRNHMTRANLEYDKLVKEKRAKDEDVEELVPMEIIMKEEAFVEYIKDSNEGLAERQTMYLNKYKAFAQNPMLQDSRQDNLRSRCMEYWKVPDNKRPQVPRASPNQRMEELCPDYPCWVSSPPGDFEPDSLNSISDQEYRLMLRTARPTVFIGLGKRFVFNYEGTRWESVDRLSIPRDTVIYAELTVEIKGEGRGQIQKPVLRVFDACYLGGENIADKAFRERKRLLGKFCAAIHRESRPDLIPVCSADSYHIEQMPSLRNHFYIGKVRGAEKPLFKSPDNGTTNTLNGIKGDLQAQGFIIYRILKDEWRFCLSKKENRLYFFNTKTGESIYEGREDAFNGFIATHTGRKAWPGQRRRQQRAESTDERDNVENELLSDLLRIGDAVTKRRRERSESGSKSDSS